MYPRCSSQFDAAANVGIGMRGRCEASGGEPWLTTASGNGPWPAGRKTRVRKVAPSAEAIPTISWAAASTFAAGAASARIAASSNRTASSALCRKQIVARRKPGIPPSYRLTSISASSTRPPLLRAARELSRSAARQRRLPRRGRAPRPSRGRPRYCPSGRARARCRGRRR
jgi:hypothetical protein